MMPLSTLILAQAKVEPVRLVRDSPVGPPAPEASFFGALTAAGGGVWITLVVAGVAVVLGAWGVHRWSRVSVTDRAFVILAMLTGVRRRDRAAMRALAMESGIAPVALLLSRGAWPVGRAGESRVVVALRDRVLRAR